VSTAEAVAPAPIGTSGNARAIAFKPAPISVIRQNAAASSPKSPYATLIAASSRGIGGDHATHAKDQSRFDLSRCEVEGERETRPRWMAVSGPCVLAERRPVGLALEHPIRSDVGKQRVRDEADRLQDEDSAMRITGLVVPRGVGVRAQSKDAERAS
jgi:hypothetical protein